MAEIAVNGRQLTVGSDVAKAVETIERAFAGVLQHDNGQAEGPFVAYGFPAHGRVQLGLRLNKSKVTLYVRECCPDGRSLPAAVPGLKVEHRYDGGKSVPVHSIKNGRVPYLSPAEAPVLRVQVLPDQLLEVLHACLGVVGTVGGVVATPGRRRSMSPEDLLAQLDRQSTTGKRGEQVAVAPEIARLRACGCKDPERYVEHVALDDVARGYDIESTWPGEERCIEVKATVSPGVDFFVSTNEREALKSIGARAWIYRVELCSEGEPVVRELRDPMNRVPDECFVPQVWRVKLPTGFESAT